MTEPRPEESPSRAPPTRHLRIATGALPPVPLTIAFHGRVVGTTLLEYPLDAPNALAGRLKPGVALRQVHPVFELYRQATSVPELERFVRERDALHLALFDRDGTPVSGSVDLISDWGRGVYMVHLTLP